jgi:hypothetical protein
MRKARTASMIHLLAHGMDACIRNMRVIHTQYIHNTYEGTPLRHPRRKNRRYRHEQRKLSLSDSLRVLMDLSKTCTTISKEKYTMY